MPRMRKLILGLAVSLDGFIEGPNGEYDWCFTDKYYGLHDSLKVIGSIFVGLKSDEMSLSLEGGIAGVPKFKEYVFSNTLSTATEGVTIVKGDLLSEVKKIKSEPGKDIW